MKLAEADILLTKLEFNLRLACKSILQEHSDVGKFLEKIDELVKQKQFLFRKIKETKGSALVAGTPLYELEDALDILNQKISVLETVILRGDLNESQSKGINEQLDGFRLNRDTLKKNVMRCYVETDLLDE